MDLLTPAEEARYAELQLRAVDCARTGADLEVLQAMIEAGLPVNLADPKGNTLLMLAAYHGNAGAVRLLLRHGANPERRNHRNQTPLGGVAFKGHAGIAEFLLDAGADINADQGNGMTPLMFASMFGRTETARLLLKRGANARRRNRWGLTAPLFSLVGRIVRPLIHFLVPSKPNLHPAPSLEGSHLL